MFSHEGTSRSDRQNRILAGVLALVAGYSNSCAFLLIGVFTSHVTGNVGRLADDAARSDFAAALSALSLVFSFFLGAFIVTMILETRALGHVSRGYASALALESALLVAFTIASSETRGAGPRIHDAEGVLVCVAMGIQNGLVTRLSGAVVRTTHLTGVLTDLAIEGARWLRYVRRMLSTRIRVPLVVGPNAPERPVSAKVSLLVTIAASFFVGAVTGALATVRVGHFAMLFSAASVAACSLYALASGRAHVTRAGAR
jgi:uncharacterized membrane protein YoaK (UPF0700 family)